MAQRKTIYDNLWYVADMLAFPDVHIFSKAFFTQDDAYNAIDQGLGGNHKRFDTIKGHVAKELGILQWNKKYRVIKPRDWISKYNYGTPPPPALNKEKAETRRSRWWKRDLRRNARNAKKRQILLELKNKP